MTDASANRTEACQARGLGDQRRMEDAVAVEERDIRMKSTRGNSRSGVWEPDNGAKNIRLMTRPFWTPRQLSSQSPWRKFEEQKLFVEVERSSFSDGKDACLDRNVQRGGREA